MLWDVFKWVSAMPSGGWEVCLSGTKQLFRKSKPPVAHVRAGGLNLMAQMDVLQVTFLYWCLHLFRSYFSYSHFSFPYTFSLTEPLCLSLPWPRRLLPVWAPARFLQGEECVRGPRRATINISSVLRPHLCRVLNDGIFMKHKYLHRKAVSQRLPRGRGR